MMIHRDVTFLRKIYLQKIMHIPNGILHNISNRPLERAKVFDVLFTFCSL